MFSTVNVQHLESLNDQVAELTGIRVRETVPDSALGAADEVILDRHHPPVADRAAARRARCTQTSGSRQRSTTSSRSRTSPRCERSRSDRSPKRSRPSGSRRTAGGRPRDERLIDTAAPQAVGERLLALVKPQPKSQRIVRRAWRSAQRLGAELDVLWVAPTTSPPQRNRSSSTRSGSIASVLGAHLLIEHGEDVAAVAQRVAARARHNVRADGHAKAAQRASAAWPGQPSRSGYWRCCQASIYGSSPTGRAGPRRIS